MKGDYAGKLSIAAIAAILVMGMTAVPPSAITQTAAPTDPDIGPGDFTDDQRQSFAAASLEGESLREVVTLYYKGQKAERSRTDA